MSKTKTILLWGMIAGVAGCAYDVDRSMYDYPVIVSPEYALKPNTRWTSLYYYGAKDWQPEVSIQIFRDSHSVLFHRWDVKEGRSPTLYDGRVTAEKWNWIVSQLEQAGVSRWKTFYLPESFEDFPSGSVWGLDFQDGSNTVGKVLGFAVWPSGWDAFQAILDSFDVVEKECNRVCPPSGKAKASGMHRKASGTRPCKVKASGALRNHPANGH